MKFGLGVIEIFILIHWRFSYTHIFHFRIFFCFDNMQYEMSTQEESCNELILFIKIPISNQRKKQKIFIFFVSLGIIILIDAIY